MDTKDWVIFGLLIVVLVGGSYMAFADISLKDMISLNFNVGGDTTNVDVADSKSNVAPVTGDDGEIDLCQSLTENYPAYSFTKEMTCIAFGGDWRCKSDIIGCENIPAWNSSQCNTNPEIAVVKLGCTTSGNQWVCDADEIVCRRI